MCSMRIQQNGATNILLDSGVNNFSETISIVNQQSPVPNDCATTRKNSIVYTRRSRLLDEELDDTKDVIVTNNLNLTRKSSLKSGSDDPPLIELNNKTDSEKYRESVTYATTNDNSNLMDLEVDKSSCGDDRGKSVLYPGAAMPAKMHGESLMMLLRQQQLDRVAEWVQRNNEHTPNALSESSLLDSDDLNVKCTNAQELTQLRDKVANVGNVTVARHMATTSDNRIAQQLPNQTVNLINNNEEVVCSEISEGMGAITLSRVRKDSKLCPNDYVDIGNNNKNEVALDYGITNGEDENVDLAQMEYNVKQFLLKQNEWSIKNSIPGLSRQTDASNNSLNSILSVHRTETNL